MNKWRVDGIGPKFISKAKHVAYRVGDVRDWIASRTVQSTTQADSLSFVSAFDGCFVEPTIYHDQQPYSLFDSIELFSESNGETNITGFEVLVTSAPLATDYLNGNLESLLKTDNINQLLNYFTNGAPQSGTLAHLMAKKSIDGLNEYLPDFLDIGLDFSKEDGAGKTAKEYGNEYLNYYLSKRELMLNLAQKFENKNKE